MPETPRVGRRRSWRRRGVAAGALLAALIGLGALVALRDVHPGKALAIASIALALLGVLLLPLAWAESRAARRFERVDARLREAWPDAEVRDLDGGPVSGRVFVRDGRELARLLRPEAGVGAVVLLDAQGRRVEVREAADLRAVLERDEDERPPP